MREWNLSDELMHHMAEINKILEKEWPTDPIICKSGDEYKFVIVSFELYNAIIKAYNDLVLSIYGETDSSERDNEKPS